MSKSTGWSASSMPIPTPPWSRCARSSGPPARSSPSTTRCGGWATALKKTLRASEQGRADIAEKRRLWQEGQKELPAGRLVFIDESSAKTNMTRLRGRGARRPTVARSRSGQSLAHRD
ncbi:MAG: hypothetical protein WDO13_12155, partial [Verrucomicrobiota bacterium]